MSWPHGPEDGGPDQPRDQAGAREAFQGRQAQEREGRLLRQGARGVWRVRVAMVMRAVRVMGVGCVVVMMAGHLLLYNNTRGEQQVELCQASCIDNVYAV